MFSDELKTLYNTWLHDQDVESWNAWVGAMKAEFGEEKFVFALEFFREFNTADLYDLVGCEREFVCL